MTVIVYRAGVMASDGRISEDNDIFTNKAQKIFRLSSGALFGMAGDADAREIVSLFNRLKGKSFPSTKKIIELGKDFTALLALPDKTLWLIECGVNSKEDGATPYANIIEMKDSFTAVGSGAKYALGAMDRGASAEQAVKTAIKYDNQCGGAAQVFTLESKDKE